MRISDWSSDVCSSDLEIRPERTTVRIYRADNRFGDGAVSALTHLVREVWRHRAHVGLIFKRDFRAAYRGTTLGIFWNFALPLLPVSVYVFLSVMELGRASCRERVGQYV